MSVSWLTRLGSTVLLGLAVASCDRSSTAPMAQHVHDAATGRLSPDAANKAANLARDIRAITSKYQSKRLALADGYAEDAHCVEHPTLGGMGHHFVNGALVDPVYQPARPEVMLYAPDVNGRLVLAAVEYIVIDVGQPAPTFGGQPFDVGGTPVPVPHWSLHVWLHTTNPAGLFSPWNPNVNCP